MNMPGNARVIKYINIAMNNLIFLLAIGLASVAGSPQSRILGGQLAQIQSYPYVVAALSTRNGIDYSQECVGAILNSRSVLTAAHCVYFTAPQAWRIRAGSSYANSGGEVYSVSQLINHPQFDYQYYVNDVSVIRIQSTFLYSDRVQVGRFAGVDYAVADNVTVTAIGWGAVSNNASSRSEQLRFVQTRTVNQEVCRANYNVISMTVLPNMMCAGNLAQGGVGPCYGDFGGPLIHNNAIIGIASWGSGCGYRGYPTVFSRVPRYITWIQSNA